MWQIILIILGLLLTTLGVVCIFDARLLTKKLFSFGDQNEGSMGLKIMGFIIVIIGAFIIFFNM
jgi:hypothetical protein